jgi:hypothetical protein
MVINASWIKAALIRAMRTFAQAAIAALPTTAFTLGSVDWVIVASTAAGAAVLSVLMSVASLPEVDAEENKELAEAYLDLLEAFDDIDAETVPAAEDKADAPDAD